MPRYALKIEYHGGAFSGWQRQKEHPSVQQAVEEAIRRLEPDAHGIGAAGRTDTGVHATGQVAHCDMARDWDPFRLSEAINYHLKPALVAVVDAAPARLIGTVVTHEALDVAVQLVRTDGMHAPHQRRAIAAGTHGVGQCGDGGVEDMTVRPHPVLMRVAARERRHP